MEKRGGRRVIWTVEMGSRPIRRFSIWAWSWALAASSVVGAVSWMWAVKRGMGPGASGSGVRWALRTRFRSTMLRRRRGS